jgi:hypothetical protein
VLLEGFDLATALLLWLKTIATNASSPLLPCGLQDRVTLPDDRYVLIETTCESSKSDDYVGNRQPEDAWLSLYDEFDGEVID